MTSGPQTAAGHSTGSLTDLPLSGVVLATLPLAWLLPNHYYPWSSAWQDAMALFMLVTAALIHRRAVRLPAPWGLAIGVALLSIAVQWLTGLILFGGDALMAMLYLAALTLALAMGASLVDEVRPGQIGSLDAFAVGMVLCAVLSVATALVQWTATYALGIYVADLPPGARPFGNVGQANQLCTLLFLGLCGLGLLREGGRIGAAGFWLGACFLIFGMAMTASRTGWLQVGLLVLLVSVHQWRSASRVKPWHTLGLAIIFVGMTVSWPWLNESLLLVGGRSVVSGLDGGSRVPLWWAMVDALWREPWTGYGWQQIIVAQQAVASDHPFIGYPFEHSHNVVLDLLLWAGIPLGVLIVALVGSALLRQVRKARDVRVTWLMAGIGGVVAHAMVELPHEYAYLLLPMGLAAGAAHALSPAGRSWAVPVPLLRFAAATMALLLGAVGAEYLRAEQAYRLMRLEAAKIGVYGLTTPPPELPLLTQLGAFMRFVHSEARPNMTPAELASMREVSARFAYPPVMFRYALAAGLNGQPAEAETTLVRLCRMQRPERCSEAREGWQAARSRYRQLAALAFPESSIRTPDSALAPQPAH
ncbi:MAG: hypothetical protein C0505_04700 [Leptothrix sp. (in: Bacteria)]|nr:hypothetical protein [Leptothrix sp. (in: b-proteobacteria)]